VGASDTALRLAIPYLSFNRSYETLGVNVVVGISLMQCIHVIYGYQDHLNIRIVLGILLRFVVCSLGRDRLFSREWINAEGALF
jgi:hypothetical protein